MRATLPVTKPKTFVATSPLDFFIQVNEWLKTVDSDRSDYKDEAVLLVVVPLQLRSIISQGEFRSSAGRPGGIYVYRPATVKLIHA